MSPLVFLSCGLVFWYLVKNQFIKRRAVKGLIIMLWWLYLVVVAVIAFFLCVDFRAVHIGR